MTSICRAILKQSSLFPANIIHGKGKFRHTCVQRSFRYIVVIERDAFTGKCNVIARSRDSTDAIYNFHPHRSYNEDCFSLFTGLREGVQQRIGAYEAQTDAQRREEIRVHDVRQGVQTAGPPVSTD